MGLVHTLVSNAAPKCSEEERSTSGDLEEGGLGRLRLGKMGPRRKTAVTSL